MRKEKSIAMKMRKRRVILRLKRGVRMRILYWLKYVVMNLMTMMMRLVRLEIRLIMTGPLAFFFLKFDLYVIYIDIIILCMCLNTAILLI